VTERPGEAGDALSLRKDSRGIRRLLVANRGEIAVRIFRTCREMGIQTVAVHSEADTDAPFVRAADTARCIGPAPASESYLRGDVIVDVARTMAVDAIHPGYGFLSEQASFAEAVERAGITFVGPAPVTSRARLQARGPAHGACRWCPHPARHVRPRRGQWAGRGGAPHGCRR